MRSLRYAVMAAPACAAVLALAGPAQAAQQVPTVSTGSAKSVSFASATLTGTVNPNGADTSYYFQYGVTRSYGGQTAIADAGAGTKAVSISLPISGLQPITVYHYRLVAVNSAGASIGGDQTLLTTKVPLSLQILASPNPVAFGGDVLVQGTLSGTGNGTKPVTLQAATFPFTGGFTDVGNTQLTSATGGFSFPVLGLATVTQFRVVTSTVPPVVSPVAVEAVAVSVNSHVARAGRPGFARIYGTVSPAENGMQVGILRIEHGRGVLVGGTSLVANNATSSRFSKVIRARRGVYRVLVRVTTGAQISSYGQQLLIR